MMKNKVNEGIVMYDEPILTDVVIVEDAPEGFEFAEGVVDRWGKTMMGVEITHEIARIKEVWRLVESVVTLICKTGKSHQIQGFQRNDYFTLKGWVDSLAGNFGSVVDFNDLANQVRDFKSQMDSIMAR